jgi:hypothetical protein
MVVNRELKQLLEHNSFSQIDDPALIEHINTFSLVKYKDRSDEHIENAMVDVLLSSELNSFVNVHQYKFQEIIIGVTQFIDSLIMKHGLNNIQILEHDYKYYHRLQPDIQFAQVGNLEPNGHLIMSMPFAGHCSKHKQMEQIIEECNQKSISVHLDCAWMGTAKDINFDFGAECVKSFAMSFSKPYGLYWNRVGIRWSKNYDETDAVTIFNNFDMYNSTLIRVAYHYLINFNIDYLWNKYRKAYEQVCKETYTFPTNIVWLGKDVRGQLIGMGPALLNVCVSN